MRDARRAVLVEDLECAGGLLEVLLAQVLHLLRVVHGDRQFALDDDALEPLRAHHRPQSRAAGRALLVVHDAGGEGELLAGRPDGADLDALAVPLHQKVFQGRHPQAPEVAGIPQFGLAFVDEEIHRLGGDAAEEHAVEAGELEVRPEVAAAVGVAPAAGFRGLGDRDEARADDGGSPGEGPGQQAQHVLRSQGVGALGDAVVKQPRPEPVAADVVAAELFQRAVLLVKRPLVRSTFSSLPMKPLAMASSFFRRLVGVVGMDSDLKSRYWISDEGYWMRPWGRAEVD